MADACLQPMETIKRVLLQSSRHGNDSDTFMYDLAISWLGPCGAQINPLTTYIVSTQRGALELDANITALDPSCSSDESLRDAVRAVLNITRRERPFIDTCNGAGAVGQLFDQGILQGLCNGMMTGVVDVFKWQLVCGILLLLLAVILPRLWHSHFFPPMACSCRPHRFFSELRETEADADPPSEAPAVDGRLHGSDDGAQVPDLLPLQAPSECASSSTGDTDCASGPIPRQCSSHDVL